MATTAWHTLTRFAPRQWLLADGQIITEPVLEQTASGRKIRVQGTTDSVFYGELNALLSRHAHKQAEALGSAILSDVTDYEVTLNAAMDFDPQNVPRAKLHVLGDKRDGTVAWWKFQLPSTPFHVYLVARIDPASSWNRSEAVAVTFTLWMPQVQLPGDAQDLRFTAVTDARFPDFQEGTRWSASDGTLANYYTWMSFLSNRRPGWSSDLLGHWTVYENPRKAVSEYVKIIRSIEQEETIQIPDASTLDKPGWLTLELADTNVNSEFINDMTEYLDTDAVAERILDLYNKMRDEFRSLGVETSERSHDDFTAAIMSGEKGKFSIDVENPASEAGDYDYEHTLSVHLPSGTFVVECNHREPRGEVLERWEEAKTIAALGGEEDELLAFARAVAKKKHRRRTKSVIARRKGAD